NEADKAIIIVRKKVDERLLRTARSITQDLFDKRDIADDEDGLIHDIRQLIEKKEKEIQDYKTNYKGHKYPGMSLLDKGLEYFSAFDKGLDNLAFFTKLEELEDDLFDWFEDIHYVHSFFHSNQQSIFDHGLAAIETFQEVKNYVPTAELEQAMNQFEGILNEPSPYGKMKDIPSLGHVLDEQTEAVLSEKKN